MENDILKVYIDKLLNEVAEQAKHKVFLSAQLDFYKNLSEQLNSKVQELETALDKAKSKKKSDSEI